MTKNSTAGPRVRIVKEFKASPQKVFDAWLDPEILSQWMFGKNIRDEEIIKLETNPLKGGVFSFIVRRGDDIIKHLGTYLEIDRPNKLVFTWGIESESEGESVVRIEIHSTQSGCRLMLTHEMDPKWSEYTDRTRKGWTSMLDKLKTVVD